jgi:release factor glutamine methyltransferase
VSSLVERLRAAGCVFAEDEARLLAAAAHDPRDLEVLVGRRERGVPLEHVLGWAQFAELRIAMDDGVFVPRRRTELLGREAVARAAAGSVVVELCCGAGAVAALVAARVPAAQVYAADIDPVAVRCARRNLGTRVFEGDLYAALPVRLQAAVHVLVANAPYVPTGALGTMPPEARLHEPRAALDGGPDGLAVLRRVIRDAPRWLAPGGSLLVESSVAQAGAVAAEMSRAGLRAGTVEDDGTAVVAGLRTG